MSEERRDYYEVLGVAKDADQKTIRDAFRTLALKHHPDRDKSVGAEEKFKEIAEAYAVLSDPQKRTEYDNLGFAGLSGFSRKDLFDGIDLGDLFGGYDFGAGIFDRFFGGRRRSRHGANLEVQLAVSLERIAKGGEEKVFIRRKAPCGACGGSGAERGTRPESCRECHGTGQIRKSRQENRGDVLIQEISTCPVCHGRGVIVEKPCAVCGGSGEVEQDETLAVSIPMGIEEGMTLKVSGKGMPSREGGPPGDLYVVIRILPDERFERDGADLWHVESIPVTDAVLGTELSVSTLDGEIKVTVPPGAQPESVLRLKGKGLPRFGSRGKGDLYLKLKVRLPGPLSREERLLYEKLRVMTHGSRTA